jgi:nitrogen regulatory protein P-II 1
MTVTEASGYGRRRATPRSTGAPSTTSPGAEDPHRAGRRGRGRQDIVDVIASLRHGKIGDGKVWVSPVDTIVRVRTRGDRPRRPFEPSWSSRPGAPWKQ